jgi:small subunit ribosomal protein S5
MASRYDAQAPVSEYQEKVVSLNRVSKTVKGGRIFKFAALVVVGNQNGSSPWSRKQRVPDAIRKGIEERKRTLSRSALSVTNIPH